jgi:regulator of sirC expression with transglutaminase-like and TPR domain
MTTALDYFALLVCDDQGFPLIEAVSSLAQDEDPQLDLQALQVQLDQWSSRLARRLPADAAAVHKLRVLNRFFFEDLGFTGQVNDPADPHNWYLHHVMQKRSGSAVVLALIYMELAAQNGLRVHGVAFPGQFLLKLTTSQGEVVMDPLNGQSLSREDLSELCQPWRDRWLSKGAPEVPLGYLLQAASPREILVYLLRQLKDHLVLDDDLTRLVPLLNRLVLVLPEAWAERRDRGLALVEGGHYLQAIEDLELYLTQMPGAEDSQAIAHLVGELRDAENRRQP